MLIASIGPQAFRHTNFLTHRLSEGPPVLQDVVVVASDRHTRLLQLLSRGGGI